MPEEDTPVDEAHFEKAILDAVQDAHKTETADLKERLAAAEQALNETIVELAEARRTLASASNVSPGVESPIAKAETPEAVQLAAFRTRPSVSLAAAMATGPKGAAFYNRASSDQWPALADLLQFSYDLVKAAKAEGWQPAV